MKRPSGLGRGLGALIEDARQRADDPPSGINRGVREIAIAEIRPNPNQPRKQFSDDTLGELAASISARGILQPILLREAEGGGYQIIAGERRWRAAQMAQLHQIPAIVRRLDDAATAEIALIENVQRQDLNAIEEADGYRQLIVTHSHTQDEVARLVGKSRSHVTNLLRLLDLPADVRALLVDGALSMGHARALAASTDPSALARRVVDEDLSVRQVEALVRASKPAKVPENGASSRVPTPSNPDLAALEGQIGDLLGLKVKLTHGAQGGAITLHYSTLDQLDMICQRLSGEPI